jgi:hypothetical protein
MKLSDRAVLLSLRISQWTGTATEKNAAREIEKAKGAQDGVVRARKVLMPNFPELDAAQKYNTGFRNWFNECTLEYNAPQRLAPVLVAEDLIIEIGNRIKEGETYADAVATAYPDHLDNAETNLGELFDRTLYPSVVEIRNKFSYRLTTSAVPDADDLRNFPGFSQAEVDKIVANAETAMKEQVAGAVRDIWQRVYDATSAMATKLSVPIGDTGSIFRDSLVSNIEGLVDLLPKLNLFDDPEIAQTIKEMQVLPAMPEMLRTDPRIRHERSVKAKALAEKAKSYLI